MSLISAPFGWLMHLLYSLVKNYGVALILFTLITKIFLFPLSIKQQKNTARTAALSPKLEKLKKKWGNNKEKYNEEMMRLYSEENVNPMSGCLPLLIQMPIIIGLYNVIYQPLKYILRIPKDIIDKAAEIISNNPGLKDQILNEGLYKSTERREVEILTIVQNNSDSFKALGSEYVDKINNFDFSILGIDFGRTPTLAFNLLLLIPILSFLTNLAYTIYTQRMSRKMNPAMQQMGVGMNAMLYIMPIISAVFSFSFPAGVGVYWIISTVFGFLQTMLLYKLYSPERVAAMDAKRKKTKKKPSFYQRALEAQQMQNGTKPSAPISSNDDDTPEEKLSKSAVKDLQRQRLNEARRRMAEKYGDDYDSVDE